MQFDPSLVLINAFDGETVSLSAWDQPNQNVFLGLNASALSGASAFMLDTTTAIGKFDPDDPWSMASIAADLPAGSYRADGLALSSRHVAAWALAQYSFKAHKGSAVSVDGARRLLVEDPLLQNQGLAEARAIALVRDLVNQPANLLGPAQLANAARTLAAGHDARIEVIEGAALAEGFPAILAVGQAAAHERQPRVIDMAWGNRGPRITLVGKGVIYDTGGLNIKPGAFMRNMKKDMGGGAHALGLAAMIMARKLPVRLRVIVGVAENSISATSFRPGDVIKTRKGSSIEIGNTDAEGRLVLADCLTLAQEGPAPDLLIDFATLTGAARVALGTDMPAVFSNQQATANTLVEHSFSQLDPLWSLPLYRPYAKRLKSDVADMGNIAEGERYGDAIVAALFLDHFVDPKTPWLHLDCFAWNSKSQPGRPKGGEAQGLFACLALIESRLARAS